MTRTASVVVQCGHGIKHEAGRVFEYRGGFNAGILKLGFRIKTDFEKLHIFTTGTETWTHSNNPACNPRISVEDIRED